MGPDILWSDHEIAPQAMLDDAGDARAVIRGGHAGGVGKLVTERTAMLVPVLCEAANLIECRAHDLQDGLPLDRLTVGRHLMRGHGTEHREEQCGKTSCERSGATAKHAPAIHQTR